MVFGKIWSWWTRDSALHTYIYAQTLISLPFAVFSTYVTLQLQTAGYVIGTDGQGQPCSDTSPFCIVDWAGTSLDLNAVLLYMQASQTGLSGFVTLFTAAYFDYWPHKQLLVTLLFITYGVITVPVYWLQDFTHYDFQVLTALPIIFTIATNIIIVLLNIYIPYCMRGEVSVYGIARTDDAGAKRRGAGFKMAALGAIANSAGACLMYVIVIIIQRTTGATSPGLLVMTIVGFVTIAASIVCYFGLPQIPVKLRSEIREGVFGPVIEFVQPFRDMSKRRSMSLLLLGYTIYIDTQFAIASVVGQLFFVEVRPGTFEYSLYALASTICGVVCSVVFFGLQPRLPVSLETWLLFGYAVLVVTGVWGCIGFADVDFGYKNRWEFYIQQFLVSLSGIIAITSFRVLFSEMIPPRNEVRWFSLQFIISSATVWVNYVASAPLQNATHDLRYPLVLSTVFATLALVLELVRNLVPYFRRDRDKWLEHDKVVVDNERLIDRDGISRVPPGSDNTTKVGEVVVIGRKL